MKTDAMKKYTLPAIHGAIAIALIVVTFAFKCNWASLTGVLLITVGIFLNFKRWREGLLLFAAGSGMFVYMGFVNKFYGEAALNIGSIIFYIVSYFRWHKRAADNKINSLKFYVWPFIIGGLLIAVPVYMLALKAINTRQPLFNSISTFMSFSAVVLCSLRTWEQFIFSVLNNVFHIVLWTTTMAGGNLSYLPTVIFDCCFVLINAYYLVRWIVLWRRQEAAETSEIVNSE